MSTVTILTAVNGTAAKTVTSDGRKVADYNLNERREGSFTFEQRRVVTFDDLDAVVSEAERDRRKVLIRGVPTPLAEAMRAEGRLVWRLKDPKPDREPTFRGAPQTWAMGDVDQLPALPGMDPTSLDAATYAREQLPPEWQRSRLRFQFSNSAHPAKGVIKVHFFALLDRPVEDARLCETFEAWNAEWRAGRSDGVARILDPALCDPIQLHFTAPPIVVGGPDPLEGRRSGILPGASDTVELRLRTRHGRGFAPGESATLAEIERDETGKAVAGREGLLLRLRLEVLREKRPATPEEFFAEVWERFRAKVKLAPTPGKSETYWTEDKVFAKCRADWPNRERLMGRKPVPGGEPEFPAPNPVPLAVAQETARRLFADYLFRSRDLVIRGGVGLGKTELAAEALAALPPGKKVAYYAPAHVNLSDVAKRIGERNPAIKVVVVQPRNEKTCSKWEHVEAIGEKGGLVGPVLCGRKPAEEEPGDEPAPACKSSCANRLVCGYWLQFEEPAQVYLFATEQLRFEPQEGLPKFDHVIVDEAFWQTFVQHVDVELAELLALRNAPGDEVEQALRRALWEALTDREPLLDAVRAAWAACVDRALAEEPEEPARPVPCGPASGVAAVLEKAGVAKRAAAREAAREARRGRVFGSLPEGASREEALARLPEELARMAQDIHDAWLRRYLGRAEPGAEGERMAAIVAGLPTRPTVERLLLELAAELVEAPTRARSIAVVWAWRKEKNQTPREVIEVRFAPGRARIDGPTMFLDATADEEILRCFKPEAEFVRIDVEQPNADVTQIYDNRMSRTGLKDERLQARVQAVLDHQLKKHAAPAVFFHKRDHERKTFTLPLHARDGYLGHTRGRNDWEACDAAFVAGGYLPAIDIVERAAAVRARIAAREVNLTGAWEDRLRGGRMRGGSVQRVWNRGHADPLADAVLKQIQAAELAQTAGRIRAVRATAKKHIVLLTSVVVDMDVDRLVKLDELAAPRLSPSIAAVRARFDGFLIFSAPLLRARAPTLFGSEPTARRWLAEVREVRSRELLDLIGDLSALLPGTYRADGQGARDVEFLAPPDCEDPRAALESLTGQTFARFTVAAPPPKLAPSVRLTLVLRATGVHREPSPAPPEYHPPRRQPGGEAAMTLWK